MCLIVLAWQADRRHRLVLAANRDEQRDRPAAPAHWWEDAPAIVGGRDLKAGGTWLGATRDGRFAAITNFRDPGEQRKAARSRGELVAGFLTGSQAPAGYLESVASRASAYQSFNLLVGDQHTLACLGSREGVVRTLAPGIHALSNHLLNTPWPKVRRAREALARALNADDESLFALLADKTVPADAELPDTGVGLERERQLAPVLITGERYGTRASTVLRLGAEGGRLEERTLDGRGEVVSRVAFDLPAA